MAGANLKDPKNNDLASPNPPYDFGSPADSENNPTKELPGSALVANDDQSTPQAKRAGYGYAPHKGGSAMGGHNIDSRNQYTMKLPRGSSL
jgi:hypothetical protein